MARVDVVFFVFLLCEDTAVDDSKRMRRQPRPTRVRLARTGCRRLPADREHRGRHGRGRPPTPAQTTRATRATRRHRRREAHAAAGLTTIDIERASLTDAGGQKRGGGLGEWRTSDRVDAGPSRWSSDSAAEGDPSGPASPGPRTPRRLQQLTQPGGAQAEHRGRPGKTGQRAARVRPERAGDGEYVPVIVAIDARRIALARIVKLPAIEVTGAGGGS